MNRTISIAPVRKAVVVEASPQRAFEVFTAGIDSWWPKTHGIGAAPLVKSVIEPFVGGRWYTHHEDGKDVVVGHVRAWEPGARFVVGWEISADWKPDARARVRLGGGGALQPPRARAAPASRSSTATSSAWARARARRCAPGWTAAGRDPGVVRQASRTGSKIMSEFIVHGIPGSPYGRAVLIALEEKGARYRFQPVAPGTLRTPEHLALHPFGRVPVLEHRQFRLYETAAILRYLERVLPSPLLVPVGSQTAARVDQLMNINDWYLFQGPGNVIAFQRIVGPKLMGLAPG